MINYGWSPCQEGAKKTLLLRITPGVPGVPSAGALQHGGWDAARRQGAAFSPGECWALPSSGWGMSA